MEDILALAKSGNQNAICKLFEVYDPTMRKFAYKLYVSTEDAEAAEDSLQHARFVIARKLNKFRELAKLSTWLYSIIKMSVTGSKKVWLYLPFRP